MFSNNAISKANLGLKYVLTNVDFMHKINKINHAKIQYENK
jgi:hypothetical protein